MYFNIIILLFILLSGSATSMWAEEIPEPETNRPEAVELSIEAKQDPEIPDTPVQTPPEESVSTNMLPSEEKADQPATIENSAIKVKSSAKIDSIEVIGEFSVGEQQILFNHFRALLSNWYHLLSNKPPSPENVASIQPGLRRFHLQIIREMDLIQIYLGIDLNDQQIALERSCDNCTIKQVQEELELLFLKIARQDGVKVQNEIDLLLHKRSGFWNTIKPNRYWHATATSIALLSTWIAFNEADKHNRLIQENNSLKLQYSTTTSTQESNQLRGRIDENDTQIDKYKQNYQIYSLVALGGFLWEGYLLWKDLSKKEPVDSGIRYSLRPFNHSPVISIAYQSSF